MLLVAAYIVEEIAVGLFHGKTAAESFPEIGGGGIVGVLTVGAIMGIALVPFFSFREIARAIGASGVPRPDARPGQGDQRQREPRAGTRAFLT